MRSVDTKTSSEASGESQCGSSAHRKPELSTLAVEVSAPKEALEITVSRRFLDRHPKSRVHGIGTIHTQTITSEGSVGRLDDCQHSKVINVDISEDWLAWERRSREQETLHGEGSTGQELPSVRILQGRHCNLIPTS